MIAIFNTGPHEAPDSEPRNYIVRINDTRIAAFTHVRGEGLAECLRKAADAVDLKAAESPPK